MPKGMLSKRADLGRCNYWFQCGCGHRWEGSSQSAKDVAFRLHARKCEVAKGKRLQNHEMAPIAIEKGKQDNVTLGIRETGAVVLNDGTVVW